MGRLRRDFSRDLYFHSLTGTKEFIVPNRILQNESFSSSTDPVFEEFRIVGDRGSKGHSTTQALDPRTGVIFFTQVAKNGVGCWNTRQPLNPSTSVLVDSDPLTMIMPIDLKLDNDGYVWLISNRMPHFIQKKLNFRDYNYRVFVAKVSELIKGTICNFNYYN